MAKEVASFVTSVGVHDSTKRMSLTNRSAMRDIRTSFRILSLAKDWGAGRDGKANACVRGGIFLNGRNPPENLTWHEMPSPGLTAYLVCPPTGMGWQLQLAANQQLSTSRGAVLTGPSVRG